MTKRTKTYGKTEKNIPIADAAASCGAPVAPLIATNVPRNTRTSQTSDVLSRPEARVRIVTGDDQDVTEPTALRHLPRLPLIAEAQRRGAWLQLEAYRVRQAGDSFHPKAWPVRGTGAETAWVGTSNVSRVALHTGLAWNDEIATPSKVAGVCRAFEHLWSHPATEAVDDDQHHQYGRQRRTPMQRAAVMPVVAQPTCPIGQPRLNTGGAIVSDAGALLAQPCVSERLSTTPRHTWPKGQRRPAE